jgi:lysozyme
MKNAKEMLKVHEGFSNVVYACSQGHHTIGYGHNIDANPLPPYIEGYLMANGSITPQMAEFLLDNDIQIALSSCRKLYPKFDTLPDDVQDVLVDFVFNVGMGTALKFKHFNLYINQGDYEAAAMELVNSLWCGQVHARCDDLVELLKSAA